METCSPGSEFLTHARTFQNLCFCYYILQPSLICNANARSTHPILLLPPARTEVPHWGMASRARFPKTSKTKTETKTSKMLFVNALTH